MGAWKLHYLGFYFAIYSFFCRTYAVNQQLGLTNQGHV
jgi:hypothetical protein